MSAAAAAKQQSDDAIRAALPFLLRGDAMPGHAGSVRYSPSSGGAAAAPRPLSALPANHAAAKNNYLARLDTWHASKKHAAAAFRFLEA